MSYLEKMMKNKGITQAELARRLGISRQAVHKYCVGAVKLTYLDTIYEMAHILNVDLDDFVKGLLNENGSN